MLGTHFNSLVFQDNTRMPALAAPEMLNQSGIKWRNRWWGWQWYQLDNTQIIRTNNHASTYITHRHSLYIVSQ